MLKRFSKDQSGLVSITLSIIIVILMSITVVGFVLVVQREQRRALDRQLSSQAFYAAEAGIKDARVALEAGKITGNVTTCSDSKTKFSDFGFNLGQNIEYTCVLINTEPTSLEYTNIGPEKGSFTTPVKSDQNIRKIRISWETSDSPNNLPSNFDNFTDFRLPTGDNSQQSLKQPLLRLALLPGFEGSSLNRNTLINSAHTMFLYPNYSNNSSTVGNINYIGVNSSNPQTKDDQGRFVSGNCNQLNKGQTIASSRAEYACNVDINIISADRKEYFLAIQPLYQKANISVRAFNSSSSEVKLTSSQVIIDATGRSADVLRRIQVRVPTGGALLTKNTNQSTTPANFSQGAALSVVNGICKLIAVDKNNLFQNTLKPNGTECKKNITAP